MRKKWITLCPGRIVAPRTRLLPRQIRIGPDGEKQSAGSLQEPFYRFGLDLFPGHHVVWRGNMLAKTILQLGSLRLTQRISTPFGRNAFPNLVYQVKPLIDTKAINTQVFQD